MYVKLINEGDRRNLENEDWKRNIVVQKYWKEKYVDKQTEFYSKNNKRNNSLKKLEWGFYWFYSIEALIKMYVNKFME